MEPRQRKKESKPQKAKSKNSVEKTNTSTKTTELSASSGSILPSWVGLLVALLSLSLGLLTPPLLSEKNDPVEKQQRRDLIAQSRKHLCRKQDLQEFWHESMVPGFHILCFHTIENAKDDTLKVTFYKYGMELKESNLELPKDIDWPTLQEKIASHLNIPPMSKNKQPWALFSTQGLRLISENSIFKGDVSDTMVEKFGMALLYEGGQFIWPGVRIGYQRTVELYTLDHLNNPKEPSNNNNKTVTLETLSLVPLVFSVEGFLSDVECNYIQEAATPTMRYSDVVLMDKDAGRPSSDFRTSQTAFLQAKENPILVDIDYRTASLIRIPRDHQEHTQVLRYGLGEKYLLHHDYFDPALYQNDESTLEFIRHGGRNRMATVFWYLSDVDMGGETVFPRFNRGQEKSTRDCETGLKVRPQKGKVIIFYSLTADGHPDSYSLHGACPVQDGVKWAANKWVWNEPMPYITS